MDFREGAQELRDVISPENSDDVARLRVRVEQIKIALEERAGTNQYQLLLIRDAISAVIHYFAYGRRRDEREGLGWPLARLERAADLEAPLFDQLGGSQTG